MGNWPDIEGYIIALKMFGVTSGRDIYIYEDLCRIYRFGVGDV